MRKKRPFSVLIVLGLLVSAVLTVGCNDGVHITYGVRIADYDTARGTIRITDATDNDRLVFAADETVKITATPRSGYRLSALILNGEKKETTDGVYIFTIRSAVTVTAEFNPENDTTPGDSPPPSKPIPDEPAVFSVSADFDAQHGNVIVTDATGNAKNSFARNETVTVRVTPAVGYCVSGFTVNGNNATVRNGIYTFTATENVTVEAEFAFDASTALAHALQAADEATSYVVEATVESKENSEGPYRIYITETVVYEDCYGAGFLAQNGSVYAFSNSLGETRLTGYFATPRRMSDCRAAFGRVNVNDFVYANGLYTHAVAANTVQTFLSLVEKSELWRPESDYQIPAMITIALTGDFVLDTIAVTCENGDVIRYVYNNFNAAVLPDDLDVTTPTSVLDAFTGRFKRTRIVSAEVTATDMLIIDAAKGVTINGIPYDVVFDEMQFAPAVVWNDQTYYLVKTSSVLFTDENNRTVYEFKPQTDVITLPSSFLGHWVNEQTDAAHTLVITQNGVDYTVCFDGNMLQIVSYDESKRTLTCVYGVRTYDIWISDNGRSVSLFEIVNGIHSGTAIGFNKET